MAEYNTPVTGHAARMSAWIAGAIILLMILSYVFNASNTSIVGYINWGIILVGLIYSGYSFRRDKLDGYMSFNKSFTVIFQTGLFYGVILSVYAVLHYTVVEPGALQEMTRTALEQSRESRPNMTQEQLEMSRDLMNNYFYTWWGMSIAKIINGIIWGVIGGLLISLFLKKERPSPSPFN